LAESGEGVFSHDKIIRLRTLIIFPV
jgi:hypothetical protein